MPVSKARPDKGHEDGLLVCGGVEILRRTTPAEIAHPLQSDEAPRAAPVKPMPEPEPKQENVFPKPFRPKKGKE